MPDPDASATAFHHRWFALLGALLLLAAIALLGWSETRLLAQQRALEQAGGAVSSVAPTPLDPSENGRLIHVSGMARAQRAPVDSELGIRAQALALLRQVEMFQWREIGNAGTGGDVQYEIGWSDKLIDASAFRTPKGHANPERLPFASARFDAPLVTLGDFRLGAPITQELHGAQALTPDIGQLPPNLAASFQVADGMLVTSANPARPQLGDVRVRYHVIPEQEASVIGAQNGSRIDEYRTPGGATLLLVATGAVDAAQMLVQPATAATATRWLSRLLGAALLLGGWWALRRFSQARRACAIPTH